MLKFYFPVIYGVLIEERISKLIVLTKILPSREICVNLFQVPLSGTNWCEMASCMGLDSDCNSVRSPLSATQTLHLGHGYVGHTDPNMDSDHLHMTQRNEHSMVLPTLL